MRSVVRCIQRWALSVALLLIAATSLLAVYAIVQVQDQRAQACRDQNTRHANTVRQLDASLASLEARASVAQRAQLQESKSFTLLLIDQLAPYKSCP